jgi:Ca2+-binding RTX toxin-like protein
VIATGPVTVVTPGSDVLSLNSGDGSRSGGTGDDTLNGSGDLDRQGGTGDDTLNGNGDLDRQGGTGDDVLIADGDGLG